MMFTRPGASATHWEGRPYRDRKNSSACLPTSTECVMAGRVGDFTTAPSAPDPPKHHHAASTLAVKPGPGSRYCPGVNRKRASADVGIVGKGLAKLGRIAEIIITLVAAAG